jgi:TP901 family phage tail tape measure protein
MANNDSKASFKVYLDFQTTGKSIKDVDAEFKKLNNTIRRDLVPGTKAYNDAVAKQRELGKVIDDHKAKVKGVGGVWSSLSKEVKAFGMIALGAIGFQAITNQIGNLITKTADLSDAYANIQKTTGLTGKEVEALAKELGTFDTRTSRTELLKLASEAGKLGISGSENIKKFVKEADMINVALGEDLGEGALLSIGKLSDIFGTGMLNIGSAINALGAASAASEGYLVDFAARLGGVAKTAGVSAPDILGYGAVLDSLGLQAEMSGTALSNFFIDFTKNVGKFESVAGMAQGSLQELIGKEGTNAGFIALLENLKATSTGADDFLRKLEKLGIDGSRGAQVFLTLSNNIGMVKDQQKIANAEFDKGTSIIDEFNIKNENFAANLEKFQKKLAASMMFLSKPFMQLFNTFISAKTASDRLIDSYNNLKTETDSLEKQMKPLVDRYDELKSKTNLSAEEHVELNDIIFKISELLPSAVSEWDKYGNAVDISTEKVKNAISSNRELIQATGAKAIQALKKDLKELDFFMKNFQGDLARGTKSGDSPISGGQFGQMQPKNVPLTDAEITDLRNKLITTQKTIYDKLLELRDTFKVELTKSQKDFITGFEKQYGAVETIAKTANDVIISSGSVLTDEQKKELIKQKDQLQKHLDELMRLRIDNMEDESAKAEAKADYEFYKLVTQAQKEITNKKVLNDTLIELQLQYDNKLAAIREDASKKRLDALAQELDDYVKTEEWAQLQLERAILEQLTGIPFTQGEGAGAGGKEPESGPDRAAKEIEKVAAWGNTAIGMIDAVSARQQAELNEFLDQQEQKKRSLQDLYDAGKISAEDYGKRVRSIDIESDKKRRELAIKQARREKAIRIFDTAINTAAGIVKAVAASPLTFGLPFSAFVAATGIAQGALIAGSPIPQFAKGGNTFADGGGVMKPRLGLIGEKGPEWVAPNWMLRDPATADVIGSLEAMRQNRSSASAFYKGGLTGKQKDRFSNFEGSLSERTGTDIGFDKGESRQMAQREYLYIKGIFELVSQIAQKDSKGAVIGWNDGDTRELEEKRTRYSDILNDNTLS